MATGSGVILESTIICPNCGHQATEQMPTDAYQFFYNCADCGEQMKPSRRLLRVLLLRLSTVSADSIGELLFLGFAASDHAQHAAAHASPAVRFVRGRLARRMLARAASAVAMSRRFGE
jgi:DNA-directed RNA polymerase subunit RPC12/RpoP